MTQFLRPNEVAQRYKVSLKTIYMWGKRPDFPAAIRIGKTTLYALADLEAWEAATKAKTPKQSTF